MYPHQRLQSVYPEHTQNLSTLKFYSNQYTAKHHEYHYASLVQSVLTTDDSNITWEVLFPIDFNEQDRPKQAQKLPVRSHCRTVNEGAYLGTLVPRVMTGAWTGVKGSSWSLSSWAECDTSPSRWRSASKWMILLTCEQAWTKVGWYRDTIFEFIVTFTNYVNKHTKLYSLDSSLLEHHQVMYVFRQETIFFSILMELQMDVLNWRLSR